jgi:hypothetical protein
MRLEKEASALNIKNSNFKLVAVAQACNPSYSGGRDQEDHGLRSTWAKSLQNPILTDDWV